MLVCSYVLGQQWSGSACAGDARCGATIAHRCTLCPLLSSLHHIRGMFSGGCLCADRTPQRSATLTRAASHTDSLLPSLNRFQTTEPTRLGGASTTQTQTPPDTHTYTHRQYISDTLVKPLKPSSSRARLERINLVPTERRCAINSKSSSAGVITHNKTNQNVKQISSRGPLAKTPSPKFSESVDSPVPEETKLVAAGRLWTMKQLNPKSGGSWEIPGNEPNRPSISG